MKAEPLPANGDLRVTIQASEQLTLSKSVKEIASFSWPFALSRLAVAINVLANGTVTPEIGKNAAAAGPMMISAIPNANEEAKLRAIN